MFRAALFVAILLPLLGPSQPTAASPADYEWSWQAYTPNPPPQVIEARVALEFLPLPHVSGLNDDFFIAMRNHAQADLANMFTDMATEADGRSDYVIRLGFAWKSSDSHPSAEVIDARTNRVIASLARPSPGMLRAAALNLRDAMAALKGDIALVMLQNPAAPPEPTPRHLDPL